MTVDQPRDFHLQKFCKIWGIVTVILTIAFAGFNTLVDPFFVFGSPTIRHVDDVKPEVARQMDIVKYYTLKRVAPDTLILGNSKAALGFDPASPSWPEDAGVVINGAMLGLPLQKSFNEFREMTTLFPVKRVFFQVDIAGFVRPYETQRPSEPFFRTFPQKFHDYFVSSLTLDAFEASIITLSGRRDPVNLVLSNGLIIDIYPARCFRRRRGFGAV